MLWTWPLNARGWVEVGEGTNLYSTLVLKFLILLFATITIYTRFPFNPRSLPRLRHGISRIPGLFGATIPSRVHSKHGFGVLLFTIIYPQYQWTLMISNCCHEAWTGFHVAGDPLSRMGILALFLLLICDSHLSSLHMKVSWNCLSLLQYVNYDIGSISPSIPQW